MNPWLHVFESRPAARIRLFCFHFAGGTASIFRPWAKALPESVELCAIQLPGRWERLKEPLFTRIPELIQAMTPALMGELTKPYAILGYSLGSLVAYEWMHSLIEKGAAPPVHFFSFARGAPHVRVRLPSIASLSDADFLNLMRDKYKGVPDAFFSDEEFKEIFLPVLRADMEMYENYDFPNHPPLQIPFTVTAGREDIMLTKEDLESWQRLTSGSFSAQMLNGGHFVLQESNAELLAMVARTLNGVFG